jgi:multiple sugar transport system permease protein
MLRFVFSLADAASGEMKEAPAARRRPRAHVLRNLVIIVLLRLVPLLGVALTSMRSIEDLHRGNYWGWPSDIFILQNYWQVLFSAGMGRFIVNSLIIAVPAVLGTLVVATMAGFALAAFRFRGNLIILALAIGGNLVPFQILAIPVRSMIDGFGLYDTRAGLILFHTAFQTGFATLFMRNFIRQLPVDVIDAARVEGIPEHQILIYVILPMIRPALAAVAVLVFTFIWNDFFWSLILTYSSDVRPVTVGVLSLRGMWLTSWHLLAAAAMLAALPPALLFFLMQRHFIAGLTLGLSSD